MDIANCVLVSKGSSRENTGPTLDCIGNSYNPELSAGWADGPDDCYGKTSKYLVSVQREKGEQVCAQD
jgi:hypothetical protein